jgi:hypothetical protein
MKKLGIYFEVGIERNADDTTEEKLKKDIVRMLQVYARSNTLQIDNVTCSPVFRRGFIGVSCRGFGCRLSGSCQRHEAWSANDGSSFIDFCDPETREMYISTERT